MKIIRLIKLTWNFLFWIYLPHYSLQRSMDVALNKFCLLLQQEMHHQWYCHGNVKRNIIKWHTITGGAIRCQFVAGSTGATKGSRDVLTMVVTPSVISGALIYVYNEENMNNINTFCRSEHCRNSSWHFNGWSYHSTAFKKHNLSWWQHKKCC